MIDSVTCVHERTEPVEVRSRVDGGTEVVAHICVTCLDQLPAAWGCEDCEWVDERRLCDLVPSKLLGRPCARHAVR